MEAGALERVHFAVDLHLEDEHVEDQLLVK